MVMTEDEARQICAQAGVTLAVRKRGQHQYVYVSRWLPRAAAEAAGYKASASTGQQFDRYVCPLVKLGDLDAVTLRQRIAALPENPNKRTMRAGVAGQERRSAVAGAFFDLLDTIPSARTGMRTWASAASRTLAIPLELVAYRVAFYRRELEAAGVRLAQSTRHRTFCVPVLGTEQGVYYSHIWREEAG
jgi:hypothetical protein